MTSFDPYIQITPTQTIADPYNPLVGRAATQVPRRTDDIGKALSALAPSLTKALGVMGAAELEEQEAFAQRIVAETNAKDLGALLDKADKEDKLPVGYSRALSEFVHGHYGKQAARKLRDRLTALVPQFQNEEYDGSPADLVRQAREAEMDGLTDVFADPHFQKHYGPEAERYASEFTRVAFAARNKAKLEHAVGGFEEEFTDLLERHSAGELSDRELNKGINSLLKEASVVVDGVVIPTGTLKRFMQAGMKDFLDAKLATGDTDDWEEAGRLSSIYETLNPRGKLNRDPRVGTDMEEHLPLDDRGDFRGIDWTNKNAWAHTYGKFWDSMNADIASKEKALSSEDIVYQRGAQTDVNVVAVSEEFTSLLEEDGFTALSRKDLLKKIKTIVTEQFPKADERQRAITENKLLATARAEQRAIIQDGQRSPGKAAEDAETANAAGSKHLTAISSARTIDELNVAWQALNLDAQDGGNLDSKEGREVHAQLMAAFNTAEGKWSGHIPKAMNTVEAIGRKILREGIKAQREGFRAAGIRQDPETNEVATDQLNTAVDRLKFTLQDELMERLFASDLDDADELAIAFREEIMNRMDVIIDDLQLNDPSNIAAIRKEQHSEADYLASLVEPGESTARARATVGMKPRKAVAVPPGVKGQGAVAVADKTFGGIQVPGEFQLGYGGNTVLGGHILEPLLTPEIAAALNANDPEKLGYLLGSATVWSTRGSAMESFEEKRGNVGALSTIAYLHRQAAMNGNTTGLHQENGVIAIHPRQGGKYARKLQQGGAALLSKIGSVMSLLHSNIPSTPNNPKQGHDAAGPLFEKVGNQYYTTKHNVNGPGYLISPQRLDSSRNLIVRRGLVTELGEGAEFPEYAEGGAFAPHADDIKEQKRQAIWEKQYIEVIEARDKSDKKQRVVYVGRVPRLEDSEGNLDEERMAQFMGAEPGAPWVTSDQDVFNVIEDGVLRKLPRREADPRAIEQLLRGRWTRAYPLGRAYISQPTEYQLPILDFVRGQRAQWSAMLRGVLRADERQQPGGSIPQWGKATETRGQRGGN